MSPPLHVTTFWRMNHIFVQCSWIFSYWNSFSTWNFGHNKVIKSKLLTRRNNWTRKQWQIQEKLISDCQIILLQDYTKIKTSSSHVGTSRWSHRPSVPAMKEDNYISKSLKENALDFKIDRCYVVNEVTLKSVRKRIHNNAERQV